jgi:hypothetical protein
MQNDSHHKHVCGDEHQQTKKFTYWVQYVPFWYVNIKVGYSALCRINEMRVLVDIILIFERY